MRARPLATMALTLGPAVLAAQNGAGSGPELVIGVGAVPAWAGAYTVGMQWRPADSRVSWRLLTEHWEHCRGSACNGFVADGAWEHASSAGIQLVGIRQFGRRALRPYVLAGAALYHERRHGAWRRLVSSGNGIVQGPLEPFDRSRLTPTPLWGVGLDVPMFGVRSFGELRLPIRWTGADSWRGAHVPLSFGIRF